MRSMTRRLWVLLLPAALLLFALVETYLQLQESRAVAAVTGDVLRAAGAGTPREKVLALRDYLRHTVRFKGAAHDDRPFLRATAAETLASGRGYCGEVTRAFVCMAEAAGVPAQRVNLFGADPHVVAEADLGPGGKVVVDCQNPPHVAELESLDKVMLRPEYEDYYSINLRRLGFSHVVARVKLQVGPLTYLLEKPHALKAVVYASLAGAMLVLFGLRRLLAAALRARGWVHVSSLAPQVREAPPDPGGSTDSPPFGMPSLNAGT